MDIVIPIVFPYVDFDNFTIPSKKERVSNLGHAGILFIDGISGTTKYYEFGRYNPAANRGLVRRIPLKNVRIKNQFSNRNPYNILTNSCIHFVKEMTKIAGIDNPWMIDPRPNSYIGEFRDKFADLDFGSTGVKP